ncbi:MAG: hypothetical protein HYV29_04570 [Ignavibacteriales bacterium]|nr:hypothetical protein [Ignavibacteriales bacterium]
MKKKDDIIAEVRKYREQHAKKFKYDLKKIFSDFKQSEQQRITPKYKVAETGSQYSVKKGK